MRKALPILFIFFSLITIGQETSYPQGAYMSIEELVAKKPSWVVDLDVQKRSDSDIKWGSGNDYRLKRKSVSKKTIRKKITAYSNGKSVYLNCYKYDIQDGYSRVLMTGRYLVFSGGLSSQPTLRAYQLEQNQQENFWKYYGLKNQDISKIDTTLLRFLYVVDTKTDQLILIDEIAVRKLLGKVNPELIKEYDKELEVSKNKEALILTYLKHLNQT